jgi:tetratricopeptide (TPR) repeat protein
VWAGQSLVQGFIAGSGIDNAAHLGGLATGLVAAGLIREGRLARVVAAGGAADVLVSAALGARFAPKVFAFARGAQAFRADDLERAERELAAADDFPRALVLRAGIRLKRHEFPAALALAERAVLARPSDVRTRAHGLRALALVSLDRYPEAILAAEEAMKSNDAEVRDNARRLRDKIRERESRR